LEAQFKVQAYASWLFNKYIDKRLEKDLFDKFLKGDILIDIISYPYAVYKLIKDHNFQYSYPFVPS
jgi:tRNA(Glu) U13 pseudouridine synthase TruD